MAGDDGQCGEFLLSRNVDESGNLFLPWHVEGFGELVLSTASLMERPAAYHLVLELARGLVNQLRNQAADWQLLGLQLPAEVTRQMDQATAHFANAVTAEQQPEGVELAEQAIQTAAAAAELLMDEYVHQALAVRHQQAAQLPTMMGATITSDAIEQPMSDVLLPAINSVAVALRWSEIEQAAGKQVWEPYDRQIDWCRTQGLRIVGGPLLQLNPQSIPDWLYLWDDDFDQIQNSIAEHVESTVQRYQGKVQIWNCAAGMNVRAHLDLSEEQKLRLVVRVIEEIRRTDPNTPMIISFDQPWGEYLAFDDLDLSPLHFADSLIRAELGVAGIGLEINLGYWPGGTLPRTRLEISRMLDRWSVLNLPLIVFLRLPSGAAAADSQPGAKRPQAIGGEELCVTRQRDLAADILPVLLAKAYVQGIIWNQLGDAGRTEYAESGLFDAALQPKPLLQTMAQLRREHLT